MSFTPYAKPKQEAIKKEKGEASHGEMKDVQNKGNKKNAPAAVSTERGKTYVKAGSTAGLHGKSKGGNPSKRSEEMKG